MTPYLKKLKLLDLSYYVHFNLSLRLIDFKEHVNSDKVFDL